MDAPNIEWIGNGIQWAPHGYTSIANMIVDCLIRNNVEILRISSEMLTMREELWTLQRQNIELKAKVDDVLIEQSRNQSERFVQCANNGDDINCKTSPSSAVHCTQELEHTIAEIADVSGMDAVEAIEKDSCSNERTKSGIIPSFAARKRSKPSTKRGSYCGNFPKYNTVPEKTVFSNGRSGHRIAAIYCLFRWIQKCPSTQSMFDDDGVNEDNGDDDDDDEIANSSPSEPDGGQDGRMLY